MLIQYGTTSISTDDKKSILQVTPTTRFDLAMELLNTFGIGYKVQLYFKKTKNSLFLNLVEEDKIKIKSHFGMLYTQFDNEISLGSNWVRDLYNSRVIYNPPSNPIYYPTSIF